VADIWVGVSGDVKFVVAGGSEMPSEDSNESSLSYEFEFEKNKLSLHQVTLLTAQGFVREEIYKWDYTAGELVNGIEDGSFVVWDSRSIQGIGIPERPRCKILQRVTGSLRDARAFGLSQGNSRGQERFTWRVSII